MKKYMYRLVILVCLVCVLPVTAACGNVSSDSGAYNAAVLAYKNGGYETALEKYKEAADSDGRKAEGYRGMALSYIKEGDYDNAVSALDTAISSMEYENEEFKTDVLFYKAEALTAQEKYGEAREIYSNLKSGARADEAYALEGCIYLIEDKKEEAGDDFTYVLEDSDNIGLFIKIYETYNSVGLEADGAQYLKAAVQIDAQEAEDYTLIGKAYNYLGDYENTCSSLNMAIELGDQDAVYMLADVYLEAGKISEARQLYNQQLSEGGNDALSYNGLTLCSIAEGDYDGALVYLELGLGCADESTRSYLLYNEIVIYEKKLDFDTAAEKARIYSEAYPHDETIKDELRFLLHS